VTTPPTTGVIPPTSILPRKGGGGWIFMVMTVLDAGYFHGNDGERRHIRLG
jgi:hypothetical protein